MVERCQEKYVDSASDSGIALDRLQRGERSASLPWDPPPTHEEIKRNKDESGPSFSSVMEDGDSDEEPR